jgi:hypothetical protein
MTLAVVLAAPGMVFGAENAGLVSGIWFSKEDIVQNVPVTIFAAVQNETDATLEGSVVFFSNDAEIGSDSISVRKNSIGRASIAHTFKDAGAQAITTRFEPTGGGEFLYMSVPGRHVSVDIDTDTDGIGNRKDEDDDNDGILDKDDAEPLVKNETPTEDVGDMFDSIAKSASAQALFTKIFGASNGATTTSRTQEGARTVANAVTRTARAVETARATGASNLRTYEEQKRQEIDQNQRQVEGFEAPSEAPENTMRSVQMAAAGAAVLGTVLDHPLLFYVLIILLLYGVWHFIWRYFKRRFRAQYD